MPALESVRAHLEAILEAQSEATGVAGAVVGVSVGDEQFSLAHGSANLNTGQEFTTDTGWLLGSVTKVLTATALLRLVGRGAVDLDAPARAYIPELTLRDSDEANAVTVRMLLNHTNGIDADDLMPDGVRGREASKSYTAQLADVGCLFEPGTGLHYSNPGFVLASRIIEEETGLPFERAIETEVFGPCGMTDATAVQTQAFLRRTAIGAFPGSDKGTLRATDLFTLPESAAGAGGTPIVTIDDMIAFGRMHLAGGQTADGRRVLSEELVAAMQTPTFDLGRPQAPPMGLGWWLFPIAGTTAAWHGGGSPGGRSSFCILPEFDAVIASFVSGPNVLLNDALHTAVIEHLTGQRATPPLVPAPARPDPGIEGEYASFQKHQSVRIQGERLLVDTTTSFLDEDHRRILDVYGGFDPTSDVYIAVAPGLYMLEGTDSRNLAGFYGRLSLLADLPAVAGRPRGIHTGLRFTPRL